MKKITILLAAIVFFKTGIGQVQPLIINNPYPKTISVSGSAEMEIVPDEIYVNITLQEYQKKGDSKKDLETIKNQFLESCRSIGVADSLISIASYSGYNSYYRMKKKKNDLNASITYQVKFRSSKLMDDLVEKMDDEATTNFLIIKASHSRITEFRRQLKIKAVQAAKEKGIYLTEAIGEKLGEAITVNEPNDESLSIYNNKSNLYANENYNASFSNEKTLNRDQAGGGEIDFKKVKLRFEVAVVFSLK